MTPSLRMFLCALVCAAALAQAQDQPANAPNFRMPAEESTTDTGPVSVTLGGAIIAPTWSSGHSGPALGIEAIRVAQLGPSHSNTPSMHRWLGMYALNGRWRFQSSSEFYWGANRWHAVIGAGYDGLRTVYQGIGNPAPLPGPEEYEPTDLRLRAGLHRRLVDRLRVGLRFDLQDHGVHEADHDSQVRTDPDLDAQQGRVCGLGLAVNLDTRDRLFDPSRGVFGTLSALHFADLLASEHECDEYELDLRTYLPLAPAHTLAWQGYLLAGRGSTPFWRLPSVGELPHSRAYDALRLRDKTLVAAQVEWRWRFSRRLGCEVYAGAVALDETFGGLRTDRLLPSLGASLRILRTMDGELVPMRIGAAWGDDGWRVQVGVGDAF